MVRSRRLSVLIRAFLSFLPLSTCANMCRLAEPNMRIMYNLLGWEAELARRRSKASGEAKIKMGMGRALSWPFLAREIHLLNEKYLS